MDKQVSLDALCTQKAGSATLATLFQQQPDRGEHCRVEAPHLQLDYSKQRVTDESLQALEQLAESADLPGKRARLFAGEVVNPTENRAAWHTALRVPAEKQTDSQCCVEEQLQRMSVLVEQIQSGVWRGFSGKRIRDVVNLGVGGSDLGPLMVTHALREHARLEARSLQVHFASTIDGSQLFDLLDHLNPETTLFIVSSKSFTTIDTLSNARTVRSWLRSFCDDDALILRCHFVGVSAAKQKMDDWGIPSENQLYFWEWVGGRFSLWSTIGLPIALALGMPVFRRLLAGAHAMDEHFRTAPLLQNLPVMLALLGIWNVNGLDIRAHAILPYDGRLKYFPSYLEQLEMESNGKSVSVEGEPLNHATCPVLWGEIGANAQHAFYQLLHQGTQSVASDFILAARRYENAEHYAHYDELMAQHTLNIANCLAQSRVLAFGNEAVEPSDNPFRHYPGNQPSSTLLLDRLEPESLGALVAAYEHKVFTQAVIWNINPFDQWGVELGKQVALQLQPMLEPGNAAGRERLDSSTRALATTINDLRVPSTQDKEPSSCV
ncbi:glucose-6-phosphate isomerase [Marinobacterium marinum]|uniref:Glucose-6-phosphate isomerase n=1 Tax=Marinobacterium marinum TaxID=2756129 RepID=A0A7W2ABI5_9GAMM|nr:glucose-6-phosphate isomerase [Marinobacterium marinum]MBA4501507.1 glucose-6-phosphate isomerase [Marinobacterium marinum]